MCSFFLFDKQSMLLKKQFQKNNNMETVSKNKKIKLKADFTNWTLYDINILLYLSSVSKETNVEN